MELLTHEIAYTYRDRAKALPYNGMQDIGERRALRIELQERCGVTELEAVNIINGFHIDIYCMKYMAMTEIIKQLEKEILQQRTDEQQLKNEIAAVTTLEFAERAAGALDPKKHLYSFEGYLSLLQMLKTVLYAGMPPNDALDAVQTGWSAEKILEIWRYSQYE